MMMRSWVRVRPVLKRGKGLPAFADTRTSFHVGVALALVMMTNLVYIRSEAFAGGLTLWR